MYCTNRIIITIKHDSKSNKRTNSLESISESDLQSKLNENKKTLMTSCMIYGIWYVRSVGHVMGVWSAVQLESLA